MEIENGWIKLWRKSRETAVYQNPNYWLLWCECLFLAQTHDREVFWLGGAVNLKRGQLIWGSPSFSKRTGISKTTCERFLEFGQKTGMLTVIQKNRKIGSIIQIENYELYQGNGEGAGNLTVNTRGTSGEHAGNNKEFKNLIIKEKSEKNSLKSPKPDQKDVLLAIEANNQARRQELADQMIGLKRRKPGMDRISNLMPALKTDQNLDTPPF